MEPELIMEAMLKSKIFWAAAIPAWLILSEIVYLLICKFAPKGQLEDSDYDWLTTKLVCFMLGFLFIMVLILCGFTLFIFVNGFLSNPLGFLKVISAIIFGTGIFFGLLHFNHKIWKRYRG